jgi:nucleotide-binding universal stress UspA family protein
MKGSFNPTCDRHGHMLAGVGGSPQVTAPFICPSAQEIALLPGTAQLAPSTVRPRQRKRSAPRKRKNTLKIRKMLVPVDAEHTKPADLTRAIQLGRRFDAQITLLECYEPPRSCSHAIGKKAMDDVIQHQELTRAHLHMLCSRVRKFWSKCRCRFESGSLPAGILNVSKEIRADLIIVPSPLDSASETWSTGEVLDELVRKADCPVIAGKTLTLAALPEARARIANRKHSDENAHRQKD